MRAIRIGNIPLASIISAHAKKTHIFDGLHIALLISLGQLCDDECVAILDNNEINILKGKTIILKEQRNKTGGLWGIPISIPVMHHAMTIITREKK